MTITKYLDYYLANPEAGFRIEARRKLRKGLRKADKEPTSEAIIALGRSLLDADVPFLDVSSYRISQYLRGQFALEGLLVFVARKQAKATQKAAWQCQR